MLKENTIIVLDLGQYKDSCKERVPFKAKIEDIYENEVVVKSLKTGKTYKLYHDQILEYYSDESLQNFINLNQFGYINE